MKVTIDIPDEQIQVFAELVTANVINRIEDLEKNIYRAGQDDIGGKLHKDIKDSDFIDSDYDETLYAHAVELFELYITEQPKTEHIAVKKIQDFLQDNEIKTGLSDAAYQRVIKEISNLCHYADIYAYQKINEKYKK